MGIYRQMLDSIYNHEDAIAVTRQKMSDIFRKNEAISEEEERRPRLRKLVVRGSW
jgi:hypothetical protein